MTERSTDHATPSYTVLIFIHHNDRKKQNKKQTICITVDSQTMAGRAAKYMHLQSPMGVAVYDA